MSYFDDNWHKIRNEWTVYGHNQAGSFMTYTNNRTESINQKMLIIGRKYSSLTTFLDDVVGSVTVMSSKKDIKAVKRPGSHSHY